MLAHTAYFEALASIADETSPEWKATLAGLVVLRLVDNWLDLGAQVVTTDISGLRAVRESIRQISEGDPIKAILSRLMDAVEREEVAEVQVIWSHLMAYGQALQYGGKLLLMKDLFMSMRASATETADSALILEATIQLATTLKDLGDFNESEKLYLSVVHDAKIAGDVRSQVRAEIGRTQIVASRGDLPTAGKILDALAEQARTCGLTDVYGTILTDRAVVSANQGDYGLAIRLAYQALEHAKDGIARDRILGNIALYFAQLGHVAASRDANLVLASTTQERSVKLNAFINLMYTAILDGHEPAFEHYRTLLAEEDMSPYSKAHYHADAGMGLIKFGKPDLAAIEIEKARTLAEHYALNQLLFNLDVLTQELSGAGKSTPSVPSVETQAWPADVVAIAAAIGEWRELQEIAIEGATL